MGTYRQEYTVLADAIVTNAIVVPMDAEVKAGEQPSRYYYTDSAAWDTGAQFTLISPRVFCRMEGASPAEFRERVTFSGKSQ